MTNQQLIKSGNKKQLYTLISDIPGISRAKLASVTKLSKTTVSALVDELIQSGHIMDEGTSDSQGLGRKPNSLRVNKGKDSVVVLNWKKRSLQITMVSVAFEILAFEEVAFDYGQDYVTQIKAFLDDFLSRILSREEKNILGICFIIPGIIDSTQKRIISMVLPIDKEEPIIQRLRDEIKDYPIAIFNDSACFAYAENAFGEVEARNYFYLNISEGIGACLVQNGEILRGATGMGMQFGHFSIDRDGEPCVCGNRGCLENQIGEIALAKRAKECGALEAFEGLDQILFKDVGKLVAKGDPRVLRLLEALARDLSYGLCNLISILHPDAIIIGGLGLKLGETFLNLVIHEVKSVGFQLFVSDVDITFTSLKEEALFQGAAKYYLDMHYDFSDERNEKLFLY